MQCTQCGTANAPGAVRCGTCGTPLMPPSAANPFADQLAAPAAPVSPIYYPPGSTNLEDNVGMRLVIPIGTSPWAIASGYLGLISLICPLGFLGPFGVITGILAFRQIRRTPKLGGTVRAIVGIVLGIIGTVLFLVFVIAIIARMAHF